MAYMATERRYIITVNLQRLSLSVAAHRSHALRAYTRLCNIAAAS